MKRYVLALVLLVGCATTGGQPVVVQPLKDATAEKVARDIERATLLVNAASSMVGMLCDFEGKGTEVCLSLTHVLDIAKFAANDVKTLFETFQRTGAGLELVQQAVERVFAAIQAFDEHTALAGRVLDGTNHPVATAYCSRCCGVVVDPKAQAAPRASPKPTPAPKAP
jgi:hypothetical protein